MTDLSSTIFSRFKGGINVQLFQLILGITISLILIMTAYVTEHRLFMLIEVLNVSFENIDLAIAAPMLLYIFSLLPLIVVLPNKYLTPLLFLSFGYHVGHYDLYVEDMVLKKNRYMNNHYLQVELLKVICSDNDMLCSLNGQGEGIAISKGFVLT